MADFGRDEIDDALDGAPEIDDDSVVDDDLATPDDGEAFIGRDDSAPAPNRDRRPAEVKDVTDTDSDSDGGDDTAGVERDGDESLAEIAADCAAAETSGETETVRPTRVRTWVTDALVYAAAALAPFAFGWLMGWV